MVDPGHIEIARSVMQEIMYDNGMVDRWHPEKYPKKYVNAIAASAGVFFDAHPGLLTDEDIELICCGEESEVKEKYSGYQEYKQMSIDLNKYFNRE